MRNLKRAYLDFNDYLKIIIKKDNWKDVFRRVFVDKDIISGKLKELDPIRKSIAHSRDLSDSEFTRLRLYSGDIIQAIMNARIV